MKNNIKIKHFDIFCNLTKRHLLVFFKNKIRVLYTLLVPIIILFVYIFFLRDLELTSVNSSLTDLIEDSDLLKDETFIKYVDTLIDSWMLSGIISLSTITVSLQTNNIFVEDKENGLNRDFISSPISKKVLIISYFAYNFIVTILISFVVLLIAFIYLACANEFILSFLDVLLIILTLLFSTILSTLSMIFICLFINSEATLASIIALVSTAAGFLIGAYMPMSMLPSFVSNLCAFFPGTYSTSLLRFTFLNTPIIALSEYLNALGIDAKSLTSYFIEDFGYSVNFFGNEINLSIQAIIILIFIVVFMILNIIFSGKLTLIKSGLNKIKKKREKK